VVGSVSALRLSGVTGVPVLFFTVCGDCSAMESKVSVLSWFFPCDRPASTRTWVASISRAWHSSTSKRKRLE
jgi:hypothetical protein